MGGNRSLRPAKNGGGMRPTWNARCRQILHNRATAGNTNAEIQADIERATGHRFSLFVISRYRAAAGLPRPVNRAVRRWQTINNWRRVREQSICR